MQVASFDYEAKPNMRRSAGPAINDGLTQSLGVEMAAQPDVSVVAALVTGALGLLGSIVSIFLNQRNHARNTELETRLSQIGKERDAWRDYEFEALKRLYEEVRPILFQIRESCNLAIDRLERVLKREIDTLNKVGTTTHRLFSPLVLGRELQRRLTSVDLQLEPTIRAQYLVIREMLTTMHQGRALAGVDPNIDYRSGVVSEPRQHLTWSQLERLIELYTHREVDGSIRPLRQNEAEDLLAPEDAADRSAQRILEPVQALFRLLPERSSSLAKAESESASNRVLRRLLLAQLAFMKIFVYMHDNDTTICPENVFPVSDLDCYRWSERRDDEVFSSDLAAVTTYVKTRLEGIVAFQAEDRP